MPKISPSLRCGVRALLIGELRDTNATRLWYDAASRSFCGWLNRWAAAVFILFPLLAACDQQKQAEAPPPPPPAVRVQAAQVRGVSRSYEFVGRIKAINTVALRARVEGFLDKRLFTEGQDVKAGDLLYQIEKVQFQAELHQAQANLASAKAQRTNAQLQYNRSVELVKNQNISQATVDQNKANLESAEANVLQAEAALTQAQVNLDYTDIRAPVDGRIGRSAFDPGNLVNAASGVLATIVGQDPIYVLFPVSVRELEDIRAARRKEDGQLTKINIFVRLPDGQEYSHPGVWNLTDPQVDQQTDTLTMRATLPNPEQQLVDGEFVNVEIRERTPEPRLVIRQASLQVDQVGYYVMVVNGEHKVEMRRVSTGPNQGTDVVVESGLREGDEVIVEGIQKVRPGQTVQSTTVASGGGG